LNEWSQWGACCGNNTVFRNRTENMAQWGGLPCGGPWDEERDCDNDNSGCNLHNGGLPTGAMIGIIIGAILGFLLLLALIALALYQASANSSFETI